MIQNNSFLQTIRLPVNISPWLPVYLLVIHSGALLLIWQTAMAVWLALVCCIAILIHAGFMLRRYLPRFNPDLVREIILAADDTWRIRDGHGRCHAAELLTDTFLHPRLVVLRLRCANGLHRAVIIRDRYNEAMLRRLRVRLRHRVDSE